MNKITRVSIALSMFLAVSVSTASAKSLKPVKDVQTENQVIQLYNQALKYSKAERNVHARVLLEKAATYDPTSVSPYVHAALSEIYHDLGNPDRAISEAETALRYDKSMKTLYYNLGLYCKDANRYEEGIAYLTKFAESASGDRKETALSLIQSLQNEQAKMGSFTNNDPDYLGQLMAENSAHHWPASRVPLKIYIEQTAHSKGFSPEFPDVARNAFITWYQASGKKLSFKFVDSVGDSDINVEWTDGTLKVGDEKYERMKAGLTTSTRRGDDLEHARIQIRTVRAFTKEPEPPDRIKETCLHEIGHALGLNGHSTNTADIMYFGNTARQLPALTKRDKATMARLYEAYPKYPMEGVDTSFPYPPPSTDIPRLTEGSETSSPEAADESASSKTPEDPHLTIPADEDASGENSLGVTYPAPGESSSNPVSSQTTMSSQPAPTGDSTTSGANWSGGTVSQPVWTQPVAPAQPPPGVAWPAAPRQAPPGWLPQPQGQPYWGAQQPGFAPGAQPVYQQPQPGFPQTPPAYSAMPTQPTGQAWQASPAPYYPPNSAPPAVPYSSAGPEQTPSANTQPANPIMQFAQQFMPQNNGQAQTGANQQGANPIVQFAQQMFQGNNQNGAQQAPGPTPGQMVDSVLKLFQPQQQQQSPR